jgi:hypothetical protein
LPILDLEHECRVPRTADRLKTLEVIGQGDETWRTVSMVFKPDAVYYGMDEEFRQNHLYKIDRSTLERKQLANVDGPVYYSTQTRSHPFFGVTAEGCPSQVETCASLWAIDSGDDVSRIESFEKDAFPNLFMPGTIHFPLSSGTPESLYCYFLGLKGMDEKLCVFGSFVKCEVFIYALQSAGRARDF